jgi:hypothetical protein
MSVLTRHRANRTTYCVHVERGELPEGAISNEAFVRSLYQYGIWLRPFAARDHLANAVSATDGSVPRIASAAGFYTQLAAQTEDAESLFIAFAAWRNDRTALLADILDRIQIVDAPTSRIDGQAAFDAALKRLLQTTKRVRVDRRSAMEFLTALPAARLIEVLGVPWRPKPSVQLFSARVQNDLARFPEQLKHVMSLHCDYARANLDASHNKIKHGPQVVIDSIQQCAMRRNIAGLPLQLPNRSMLRILLSGARTEQSDLEDHSRLSPAPFLNDDPSALLKLFHRTMMLEAMMLSTVIKFVLAYTLKVIPVPKHGQEVLQLVEEDVKWTDANPS